MSLLDELDLDYKNDFNSLDRENDSIVLNEKFTIFMKKHFGYMTKKEIKDRNKNLKKSLFNNEIGITLNYEIVNKEHR